MDPISRDDEPSGFVRVFVPVLGALAVAALGWIIKQPKGNPDPWAEAAPLLPEQEEALRTGWTGTPAAPGSADADRPTSEQDA